MKKAVLVLLSFLICLSLISCATKTSTVKKNEGPAVTGIVYDDDGVPLENAYVSVYLSNASLFHGPDNYRSRMTKADGSFELKLPEGTYYLVARKRVKSAPTGPLRQGDYNGEYSNNPIKVKKNQTNKIQITSQKIEGLMLFSPMTSNENKVEIKGIVKDKEGKAKEGMYVVGYIDSAMDGKPDYISKPTNNKGEFILKVPKTGKYYIAAKQVFRKRPVVGELVGMYEGTPDKGIDVKDEKGVEGIELVVLPFTEDMQKTKIGDNIKTK